MSEKGDFEILFYLKKAYDALVRLRDKHNFEADFDMDEVIGYLGSYLDETKGEEIDEKD